MRRRHDMHQPGVDTPPSCWQAAKRNLVYTALALLLSMVCASPAWARAYGNYEVRQLLVPASRPGAGGSFNMAYFDAMLSDLSEHAANYPPTFDSPADAQRAKRDTRQLIGMLDTAFGTSPPTQLLLRMALLGSIGHNLELPEGASFAQANFSRILRTDANDAQANYHYGIFLAGTGRLRESLPYLHKARDKGVTPALYSIGLAQLGLGEKTLALAAFNEYLKRDPSDQKVKLLVDAIREGKVEIQVSRGK